METIKEEKKADLEQLLNSLIEKGWKPFGRYDKLMGSGRFGSRQFVKFGIFPEEEFTLRELVSINSGLWQFVCENGMRPKRPGYEEHIWQRDGKTNGDRCILENEYQYRIIESALKNEDELEEFLLNSISLHE